MTTVVSIAGILNSADDSVDNKYVVSFWRIDVFGGFSVTFGYLGCSVFLPKFANTGKKICR